MTGHFQQCVTKYNVNKTKECENKTVSKIKRNKKQN